MDNRAYKVDPCRGTDTPVRWWETIGDTNRPSPYRKTSWSYTKEVTREDGRTFTTIFVYDGKASDPFRPWESVNRGNPKDLGSLSYEIGTKVMTITDWSHYNWHDATPVREAFKVLLNDMPPCVSTIIVKDEPTAFWRDLGFVYSQKGDGYLVYAFEHPLQDNIAVPF